MDTKTRLTKHCKKRLDELNIADKSHQDRLRDEINELAGKDKLEHYINLAEEGWVYQNENNLLVAYLLGVCEDYDHTKPPSYTYGELPDIDIDYLPKVKEYVQKVFCPRTYGEDKVCNITTYTKFGIRSALIDMARVLGLNRTEVLALTTELKVKDDEGETLTWDKAIELYDDLRAYLEKHPELAAAAKNLLNRTRGMGVHASGLIISGVPLNEFVPLVKPKQDGQIASAWVEGLSGTDLGAVGLIKFDFLGLDATQKIAEACHMASLCEDPPTTEAEEWHNRIHDIARMMAVNRQLSHKICALPGQGNWTDLSYLDDPEALEMANRGDLRMVFQFDGSPNIRKLAREGGVSRFDDLVAYTALFRPACLKAKMHDIYCRRKRGEEQYTIHPVLEDILGSTYGVILYQEQAMRILNVVGGIHLKDCEAVRKAISKKKVEQIRPYKEQFIRNGQKVLGQSEKEVTTLYNLLEDWAGYGFNLCAIGSTRVTNAESGEIITLEQLYRSGELPRLHALNDEKKLCNRAVTAVYDNGVQQVFTVTTRLGNKLTVTANHKLLTSSGWKPISEIQPGDLIATPRSLPVTTEKTWPVHELAVLGYLLSEGNTCHPTCLYFFNNDQALVDEFMAECNKFNDTTTIAYQRKDKRWEVRAQRASKQIGINKYTTPEIRARIGRQVSGAFKWAEKLGILKKKAAEKTIPPEVMTLSDACLSILLGKMWAGDGHIGGNRGAAFYATSSRQLAEDVQHCLLRLGMKSTLVSVKFKYRGAFRMGYRVHVHGTGWKKRFCETIGIHCTGKADQIELLQTYNNKCKTRWGKPHDEGSHDIVPNECLQTLKFRRDNRQPNLWRSRVRQLATEQQNNEALLWANSDIYWDKVKSIESAGEQQTYNLTVDVDHNYVAEGIWTANSHSTAYTVNSARQLWLKRHKPEGFYPAYLNNTHLSGVEDYRKMKEYLQVAARNGIRCESVRINHSRAQFYCHNKVMYYPYEKIKGIGIDVATRIEQLQPYNNYQDFVERFGTDAKPNQALIALGVFEGDRKTLFEYFEQYKKWHKKFQAGLKLYEEATCKFNSELQRLTGTNPGLPLTEESIKQVHLEHPEDTPLYTRIRKMTKRSIIALNGHHKRCKVEKPELSTFQPTGVLEDEDMAVLLSKDVSHAQLVFLGFPWKHPVETAIEASVNTFEDFDLAGRAVGPIDVLINKVEKRTSQKGTAYYTVEVEDATQRKKWITVWNADYEQFKQELVAGNIVAMRIKQPTPPFRAFTLADAPNRYRMPPKDQDHRVAVLKWRDN